MVGDCMYLHKLILVKLFYLSKPELARLRLQAGCCMLKLAEEPCFAELITREQFQALALLINVSLCFIICCQFLKMFCSSYTFTNVGVVTRCSFVFCRIVVIKSVSGSL